MSNGVKTMLSFDVGERRIGVARAVVPPRIAYPLTTLLQDDDIEASLGKLIKQERPDMFVVGLPRNQQGEATAQTKKTKDWVKRYLVQWKVPVYWQDESLTSVAAEAHLQAQGRKYAKTDVDALAASIILTDYLESRG